MIINRKSISRHPLSSGSLLYYFDGKLYRSPSHKKLQNFKIASNLPHVQKATLTDHKLDDLPVYEHKIYKHRVRIQETPINKVNEFLKALCEINIAAIKHNIICWEIHEGNIERTIDGILFLDNEGFYTNNKNIAKESFESVKNLSTKYLGDKLHKFDNKDYTNPKLWKDLLNYFSNVKTRELKKTNWFTNYSHNMDIDNPINKKAESFKEILYGLNDVETMLDVASNKGYYSLMAAKKLKSVIGFEIDESCVNFAMDLNKKLKLPAVFAHKTIQALMEDKLYETDRFKSDMVLALAIVHHLKNKPNNISPKEFVNFLDKYSKKYICLENTGKYDLQEYEKLIKQKGYELVERKDANPNPRKISLYKK